MEVLNLDNNLPQQMKLEDLIKQFSITSRFVQLNWKPVREELQGKYCYPWIFSQRAKSIKQYRLVISNVSLSLLFINNENSRKVIS